MLRYRVMRKLRHLVWTLGLGDPVPALVMRDRGLMVNRLAGTSDRLVLVFTSRRGQGKRLRYLEFMQSASRQGRHHVLFITDLTHSFYGHAALRAQIVRIVKDYMAAHRITDLRAIGNSMGGYGAILLSRALPISHIAAFVPQIDVSPEILARPAWDGWRDSIPSDVERTVAPTLAATRARVTMVFGGADEDDMLQRSRVPEAAPVEVIVLPGFGHDVARALNDRGLLGEMVQAMLDDDRTKLDAFRDTRLNAAA